MKPAFCGNHRELLDKLQDFRACKCGEVASPTQTQKQSGSRTHIQGVKPACSSPSPDGYAAKADSLSALPAEWHWTLRRYAEHQGQQSF